jgi:hypothetical protein
MYALFVTILICSKALPLDACTPDTARAKRTFIAQPGVIVCGLPSMAATDAAGPDRTEYTKTRCVLQQR